MSLARQSALSAKPFPNANNSYFSYETLKLGFDANVKRRLKRIRLLEDVDAMHEAEHSEI